MENTVVPVQLVEASDTRSLKMVEVKFTRFDTIVKRVIQYLMFCKGKLRNFRNFATTIVCSEHYCRMTFPALKVSDYIHQEWVFLNVVFERLGKIYCLRT